MTTVVSCLQCGQPFDATIVENRFAGVCPSCHIRPSGDSPPLQPGQTFRGMEILEILGAGGMGVVYKARQNRLDRFVAVKVFWPRLSADSGFILRFQREAKAMAALTHPGIVQVHDFGVEAGLCFLVMEFVDGGSLRRLVKGRMSPDQALGIMSRLCEAIDFAHVRGVIHRDLKPENILVARDGRVKVADFGLARMAKDPGAPGYRAPEQFVTLKVDARADLYSLAAVFYEMLTGALPVGPFDPPSKRVTIDSRIDDIVLKSLSQEPAERHSRAMELKSDLDAIAADEAPAGAFCDEREALKILGVDLKGLESLVERGRIRAYRIRSSRAFRRDDLTGMASYVGDHPSRRQTWLAAAGVACLLLAVGSGKAVTWFPSDLRWIPTAGMPVFGFFAALFAVGALTSKSFFRGRWIPRVSSALTLVLSGVSLVVLVVWTLSILNTSRAVQPPPPVDPMESPLAARLRVFQLPDGFESRPHLLGLPPNAQTAREIERVLMLTPLGARATGGVTEAAARPCRYRDVDLLVWFARAASPADLERLRAQARIENSDLFDERNGIFFGVRSYTETERAAVARMRLMEAARGALTR